MLACIRASLLSRGEMITPYKMCQLSHRRINIPGSCKAKGLKMWLYACNGDDEKTWTYSWKVGQSTAQESRKAFPGRKQEGREPKVGNWSGKRQLTNQYHRVGAGAEARNQRKLDLVTGLQITQALFNNCREHWTVWMCFGLGGIWGVCFILHVVSTFDCSAGSGLEEAGKDSNRETPRGLCGNSGQWT